MKYIDIEIILLFISLLSSLLISPLRLFLLYIKLINRPFKRAGSTFTLNL